LKKRPQARDREKETNTTTRKQTTVKKGKITATNEMPEKETCSVSTTKQGENIRTLLKKSEGK